MQSEKLRHFCSQNLLKIICALSRSRVKCHLPNSPNFYEGNFLGLVDVDVFFFGQN